MDECILQSIGACKCHPSDKTSESGSERIKKMIECSKIYKDGLHVSLEELMKESNNPKIHVHRNCVSTYCSRHHLKRCIDKRPAGASSSMPSPSKRRRRSDTPTFDFRVHCIFCGEICECERDPKNPNRWRPAYQCRTAGEIHNFKKAVLTKCQERGDRKADQVRTRVQGALCDLHAADARYHVDCKSLFMSPRSVNAAARATTSTSPNTEVDMDFEYLLNVMREDKSKIWNSVELHKMYSKDGNGKLSRRSLIQELLKQFGDELLILSANGIASIIVFRSNAPGLLKLIPDQEDSTIDIAIERLAKAVIEEVKSISISKKQYNARLTENTIQESVSETLLHFLSKLSAKLDRSPHAFLIASIVTSMIISFPTPLQTTLGVLMRSSKKLVNIMYRIGVTCNYDELLKFKKSAAVEATSSTTLQGISDASNGLVQTVADNFDADISSQNGKLSTHSLAVLQTQTVKEGSIAISDESKVIKRLDSIDMAKPIDYSFQVEHYHGPKQPEMPKEKCTKCPLSLKMLATISLSKKRAQTTDAIFLRDIITVENCPEYNGYNTRECRTQGQVPQPKVKAVYLPLIDMTPSDPDTMMTAMKQSQIQAQSCGQEYSVFTCDLQLYRVCVNIIWAYPEQFRNVILRLGGMHTLMSFVGSIGTLMANSGLSEILESTFGGVIKLLSGKKYPQNVRAFRMLAEELLRPLIEEDTNLPLISPSISGQKDSISLTDLLADVSSKSRTSKLWTDVFVKGVLLMMMFVRAEREGDWCLHLYAVKEMLPYFFAAGHVNYARYALYYLREMERIPNKVLQQFMKGEHVMRHGPGVFNGIWSDMYIETTFMRYGHGKRGIIGITLKPEALKVWALSLHTCSQLEHDLEVFIDRETETPTTIHKEEMKSRIISDKKDRDSLRQKLGECIHPLKPEDHPEELVNVVTGQVSPPNVNVEDALVIGKKQMEEFERGWPNTFNATIKRLVKTQAESNKAVRIGEERSFDTELIYSRVIGLQSSGRDVLLDNVLSHELAQVPTSMFKATGEPILAKNKAQLKQALKRECSLRHSSARTGSVVIDGSAILYIINWPKRGIVRYFVEQFRKYIERKLKDFDVYLVFDRYRDYSIKCATRQDRGKSVKRVKIYQLSNAMKLPNQEDILNVQSNKKQLITLICDDLAMNANFPEATIGGKHRLVITGQENVPIEVSEQHAENKLRHDLQTSHEEADNIIVQQMVYISKNSSLGITIISDDTDVFVLALYHFKQHQIKVPVVMESPVQSRATLDINATVEANNDIVSDLVAVHALSGCDTVAMYKGIGKGTALKVLKSRKYPVSSVGNEKANIKDVIRESTNFIAQCYGVDRVRNMSEARVRVWAKRAGKTLASAPKLYSLPPTTESFFENVKRAHFQACVWKHAADQDPPALDPLKYGWRANEEHKTLVPIMLPVGVKIAPPEILKMIKCSCDSNAPCSSMRCGCKSSRLSCTVFCACRGDIICCNEQTKR